MKDKIHFVAYEKELPTISIVERNPDGVVIRETTVSGKTLSACEKCIKRMRRLE